VAKFEPPKPPVVEITETKKEPKKSKGKKSKSSKKEASEKVEIKEEISENEEKKPTIVSPTVEEKPRKLLRPIGGKETLTESSTKKKPPTEVAKVKEETVQRVIEKKKKAPSTNTSKQTAKKATTIEPSEISEQSSNSPAALNIVELDLDPNEDLGVKNEAKRSVKFNENSFSNFPIKPLELKSTPHRLENPSKSNRLKTDESSNVEKPVTSSTKKLLSKESRIHSFTYKPSSIEQESTNEQTPQTMDRKKSIRTTNDKVNEKETDSLSDADVAYSQNFDVTVKNIVHNTPEPMSEIEYNRLRQKGLFEFVHGMHGAPIRVKSAQYRLPLFESLNRKQNIQSAFDSFSKKPPAAPSVDSYIPQTSSEYFTMWLVHYNLKQMSQAERHERARDKSANIMNSNLDKWCYSIDKKLSKRPISAAFASRRELCFSSTPPESAAYQIEYSYPNRPSSKPVSRSKSRADYVQLNKSVSSMKRRPTTSVAITNRPPPSTPNSMLRKENDSERETKSDSDYIHVQPTYTVSQIEMEEIMKEVNFRVEVFNKNSIVVKTSSGKSLVLEADKQDAPKPSESRERSKLSSQEQLNIIYAKRAKSGIYDVVLVDEESEHESKSRDNSREKSEKFTTDSNEIKTKHR
jgi:hypothetical protein